MAESGVETGLSLQPLDPGATSARVQPLVLVPPGPVLAGRSAEADWVIPDPTVSRRHALFHLFGDEWFIADAGSRQGTFLNGRRVSADDPMPVRPGDLIRFGRWACRCQGAQEPGTQRVTASDQPDAQSQVRTITRASMAGLAQVRLDGLLEACRTLYSLTDRRQIARAVAQSAAAGTTCKRALIVRRTGGDAYEVLASTDPSGSVELSRSLIAGASGGHLAQISGTLGGEAYGRSILDLNIQAAICAPIMVGDTIDAYLYLDSRGGERPLAGDSAAYCQALAQMAGLAFERAVQTELEEHRRRLELDLAAARRAQELMMPPRSGRFAGVRYAFESRAGRLVAGDLFDVLALDDGRAAFFLGDVSGKGIGAAVLMSAAQSQLRTLLLSGTAVDAAVASLNRHLHERSEPGKFVTLVAGVIDAERGVLEIVDAGHGFCTIAGPEGRAARLEMGGGLPLGVVPEGAYTTTVVPLAPGARVVVFTDGVVEQTDASGRQFGFDAALEVLGRASGPEADAAELLRAVAAHAGGALADDLTVASLMLVREDP